MAWVYWSQLTRTTGNTSDKRSVPMSIKNKIVAAALSGLAIAGIVAATSLSFPQSTSAQTSTPAAPTTTTTVPAGRGGPPRRHQGGWHVPGPSPRHHRGRPPGRADQGAGGRDPAGRDRRPDHAGAGGRHAQRDRRPRACASISGAPTSITRSSWRRPSASPSRSCRPREETAAKAELAQAVTDGRMTQAQADQITAERALQKYIADKGLFKSAVDSAVQGRCDHPGAG